mmetsp:Transcript_20370/g.42716  ORF Transcript_20370/g.42716 Transcript_20370/m.42716 type:complete len:130 (+) Transcript_20370:668-1057(+)
MGFDVINLVLLSKSLFKSIGLSSPLPSGCMHFGAFRLGLRNCRHTGVMSKPLDFDVFNQHRQILGLGGRSFRFLQDGKHTRNRIKNLQKCRVLAVNFCIICMLYFSVNYTHLNKTMVAKSAQEAKTKEV